MYCMKCGKDIKEAERASQVFCNDCLEVMGRYPVKPGTAVNLPKHRAVKRPASRRKPPSPEEQVQHLRRVVLRLRLAVILLVLCLVASAVGLVQFYRQQLAADNLGKNYSTATSADGT